MDPREPESPEDAIETTGEVADQVESHAPSEEVQEAAGHVSSAAEVAGQAAGVARDPSASNIAAAGTDAAGRATDLAGAAGASNEATEAVRSATEAAGAAQGLAQELDASSSPAAPAGTPSATSPSAAPGSGASPRSAAPGATSSSAPAPSPLERAAEEVTEFLLGGTPIHPVRYEFSIVVGPDLYLRVRHFEMNEELGVPYRVRLTLICDDPEAPTEELLGARCELLIDRRDPMRAIYGVIDEVEDLGVVQERSQVSVRMVPALQLLEHEVDTRTFQGKDVKEVLTEVLGASLAPYDREFDATSFLKGTYHKRDYTTQFRESNLVFVTRLMEEEGITFYFEADGDGQREKLVLVDNNADYGEPLLVMGEEIPVIAARAEEADRESISSVGWKRVRQPNRVVARGYNEKAPRSVDEADEEAADEHNPSTREVYYHDERRQIIEDVEGDPTAASFTGEELPQRQPIARLTKEMLLGRTKILTGSSNVTDMRPGVVVTIGEHPRADIDGQRFLVTKANHTGDAAESEMGSGGGGAQFANTFEAIPFEHEFRPLRTQAKPQVLVTQTAVVVGPPDEEIFCDKFGRIRVRFQWERVVHDENSSCWIRVLQPWAGPGWGFLFLPRVGMEVMVSFLDGNPDRPVVVGSLYNGDNMPPYPLPDEKTKSVIKTSSSTGGDGYNELTFEDAKGAEQIIIHAQKDFNETVENDHTTTVHNCQTIGVDADQGTSVGGNQSNTVKKDQTETVKQNRTIRIDQNDTESIGGDRTLIVEGHEAVQIDKTRSLTVKEGTMQLHEGGRDVKVKTSDKLKVDEGANRDVHVTGNYSIKIDGDFTVVEKETETLVMNGKILLSSNSKVEIKAPDCTMTMESGKVQIDAKSELTLTCGEASIGLKSSGEIAISGKQKVGIQGGPAVGEWSPTGVKASGPMLELAADAIAKLSGTMVKIN